VGEGSWFVIFSSSKRIGILLPLMGGQARQEPSVATTGISLGNPGHVKKASILTLQGFLRAKLFAINECADRNIRPSMEKLPGNSQCVETL